MKEPEIIYRESDIEKVFQKLISGWDELIKFYNVEVKFEYDDPNDRPIYPDIGEISQFIVEKKKAEQTESFEQFFENVEEIYIHGDNFVKELIVIGIFECIQNIVGAEIDYHYSFDRWLKNYSLKAWRELIDSWEKAKWRKTKEVQKILNKKK